MFRAGPGVKSRNGCDSGRIGVTWVRYCWLYQGFKHAYHNASGLVATYAMAYDCIVGRAYAYCHLSRYVISVVFCSLILLVVSASLNSQYNWASPWSDYNLCTYIASVQEDMALQDYIFMFYSYRTLSNIKAVFWAIN